MKTKNNFFLLIIIFLFFTNYSSVQTNESSKELNQKLSAKQQEELEYGERLEKNYLNSDTPLISKLLMFHMHLLLVQQICTKDPDSIDILKTLYNIDVLTLLTINGEIIMHLATKFYRHLSQKIKLNWKKLIY